jgi:hypothetical protein
VYQEPGPSTTQSASEIASVTAEGTSGASGVMRTCSTVPGATATLDWPDTT